MSIDIMKSFSSEKREEVLDARKNRRQYEREKVIESIMKNCKEWKYSEDNCLMVKQMLKYADPLSVRESIQENMTLEQLTIIKNGYAIGFGLEHVGFYAKSKFSPEQMTMILCAMSVITDFKEIEIFAKPELSVEEIYEISHQLIAEKLTPDYKKYY